MLPLVATANQQSIISNTLMKYIESFCTFLHVYAHMKQTVLGIFLMTKNCPPGGNSLDQLPEPQVNVCVIKAQLGGNSLTAVELKHECFSTRVAVTHRACTPLWLH